jgi:hypothetical protein
MSAMGADERSVVDAVEVEDESNCGTFVCPQMPKWQPGNGFGRTTKSMAPFPGSIINDPCPNPSAVLFSAAAPSAAESSPC